MKIDVTNNTIVCGNNLEWLNWIPDESIDLCYIDPPFFSNRNYEVIWGNGAELRSFGDRFSGGISHYIEWMRERVSLIHKKLKSTGSIFVHCDSHANHRLRCMLDDIFGDENFKNEIIWKRTYTTGSSKSISNKFASNTDTILFYHKTNKGLFKPIIKDYSQGTIKRYDKIDNDGRRFKWENLKTYSKERLDEMIKSGDARFNKGAKYPVYKAYFDPKKGTPIENLWDNIEYMGTQSPERLGYPTQKPEALIKRILDCSTDKDSVVLDCFCGGGTTAKVAADLGRKFIVGDVSPVACRVTIERIIKNCPSVQFEIKNIPTTEEEFRSIDGHKFAEMFCELMGWNANEKKTSDRGIDGYDANGVAVQIKNHKDKTGRPDIQKFVGSLMQHKFKQGKFVSWEFSREAMECIADVKREHEIIIEPIKCGDRLASLILTTERQLELQILYEQKIINNSNIHQLPLKKKKEFNSKKKAA